MASSPDSLPDVVTQPTMFPAFPGASPDEHYHTHEMAQMAKPQPTPAMPPQYAHPMHMQMFAAHAMARPPLAHAHANMLPICNPLPAYNSPPSSPPPVEPTTPNSGKRRRRANSSASDDGSDGGWSDGMRAGEDVMPKWSVSFPHHYGENIEV